MAELVRTFDELAKGEQAAGGAQAGALARLFQAGYLVPDGFVVLPAAFDGDRLTADGWQQVQQALVRLRQGKNGTGRFAVCASTLAPGSSTDTHQAEELGAVLDARSDERVQEAIHNVRRSRHSLGSPDSEQGAANGLAQAAETQPWMAILVQQRVEADILGVLHTADPVAGSQMLMTGSFVLGSADKVAAGEDEPFTFSFARPNGTYDGPPLLRPSARKLHKLAVRLEKELGCPQEIDWASAGGKVWILQSRPVARLLGYDAATGAWNDSLTGDFLWSRNNFGEARPDVMTPFTYSVSEKVWSEISLLSGYHMSGNICGRYYANVSFSISMLLAMGKSMDSALAMMRGMLGNVPEGLEIPRLPLTRSQVLLALPRMIGLGLKEKAGARKIPHFLATNPARCNALRKRIEATRVRSGLAAIWQEEIVPGLFEGIWIMGGSAQPLEAKMKLKNELVELVGEADANALFSSLSSEDEMLASLGPVVGVGRVARGEMSRAEYLERYGHRGPQEAEMSAPRPAEDPEWLDRQLAEYENNPVDADALLARRRADYEAALKGLRERAPKNARKLEPQISEVAPAARLRESVRDELTRFLWVERAWALRAGELTGLDDDIFFLTIDEALALLTGEESATRYIPARKETHARYQALPPYPMIIRGRFDAFEWASDPDRRNDIYDASAAEPAAPASDMITGFAGAAGRVEGLVRVLDGPEQGDRLQPGEILVAVTTNVGWTPIFPRAAAVVTDVGAPLSHAAIVARELGIPAVVGCGSATTRLRTGDRVRVDGGQGTVDVVREGLNV